MLVEYANSQEYTYRNFNTLHGLPSSETFHAIQDSKGYIWFATDNGVSRYDGYQFVNFDISNGLVNNTVFDIYEDWKGRIWFIALSGRLCYYENNSIKKYQYNHLIINNTTSRAIPVKRSFHIDSLDNVQISITNQGILKISPQGEIINLIDETTNALLIKKEQADHYIMGNLSSSKLKNKIFINGSTKFLKTPLSFHSSSLLFANNANSPNDILFSINNTIYKYQNDTIIELQTFQSDIIWFSRDKSDNYWLSLRDNGIKRFNSDNFKSTDYFWFLKDKEVSSVLTDNEGGYWFTTLNNGIYYLPSKEIKTVEISSKKSKNIYSVAVNDKSVFLALEENQIISYNKKVSKLKEKILFSRDEAPLNLIYHRPMNTLVSGTYFLCLLLDESLKKTDRNLKQRYKNEKAFDGAIQCLTTGRGHYYWAGTYSGIYKIDKKEIIYASNTYDNWKEAVYSIYENEDKSLWIGTFKGLWKYKNGEYVNLGKTNELLSHRINAFFKNSNNLFIGTKGRGLIILDLNDFTTQVIGTGKGLVSNSISTIQQYKNELWIGTNKGVNKIAFSNDSILHISRLDNGLGLTNNEINQLVIDQNMLYIATRKGFNYIDLEKLTWTKIKPQLHIQKVQINSKDTIILPNYKLASYQNNIEISFVGISYKSNKNIRYKYQLLPFDKGWKETIATEINYSNLLPGDYTFRVKAVNESGIWSEINETISF